MVETGPVVFIIDDDTSVRKSLSRLLRTSGFIVETYESGEQFLAREPYQGIGCMILDIRMPGLSGMDLHDELIRTQRALPIIFITGHGDIPMSVRAMKNGAIDFLPKPFDEEDLLQALDKAIKADKKAKEEETEHNHTMRLVEQLSPREREIVPYIISGMLNKQIAFKLGIAEKTVKVHRGRIMEKLGVASVAGLVRLAGKAGIEPPDEK
jgi:two-component system, LuxR family, response regulator FixJ